MNEVNINPIFKGQYNWKNLRVHLYKKCDKIYILDDESGYEIVLPIAFIGDIHGLLNEIKNNSSLSDLQQSNLLLGLCRSNLSCPTSEIS